MTSNFNLKANLRTTLGSSNSRRARKAGQIPAVIYDNDQNLNIVVDGKDFEHQYFKGNILTTIANIDLDGKTLQVVARKIDLNPVTDKPEHIDFIQINQDQAIKVKTKLNFINKDKSIGLKRGGFLHIVLRKVEILCSPKSIPESIDVDTADLRVGAKIKSHDLQLPNGVKFVQKNDFIIASIIGRGSKEDDKIETTGNPATAPVTEKPPAVAKK